MNPYAAPNPVPALGASIDVDLGPVRERYPSRPEGSGKAVEYFFHDHHLVAVVEGGPRIVLSRQEVAAHRPVYAARGRALLFVDTTPPGMVLTFRSLALGGLRRWLEPSIEEVTAAALRRRVRFSAMFGVFAALTATFYTVTKSAPLDVPALAVAGGMSSLWVVTRVSTRRIWFLVDLVLWCALAVTDVLAIAAGRGWVFVLFAVFSVLVGVGSWWQFLFFGPPPPLER